MASKLLAILQTRLELVSVELQEEVLRVFSQLALCLIAVFCLAISFLLSILLILVLCWENYRIPAISGLLAFFAFLALILGLVVRNRQHNAPGFLSHTRSEIQKDIDRLRSR